MFAVNFNFGDFYFLFPFNFIFGIDFWLKLLEHHSGSILPVS